MVKSSYISTDLFKPPEDDTNQEGENTKASHSKNNWNDFHQTNQAHLFCSIEPFQMSGKRSISATNLHWIKKTLLAAIDTHESTTLKTEGLNHFAQNYKHERVKNSLTGRPKITTFFPWNSMSKWSPEKRKKKKQRKLAFDANQNIKLPKTFNFRY